MRRSLAFLSCGALLVNIGACGGGPSVTRTEFLLGTTITITLLQRVPETLFESLFARVLEIEQRMSTTQRDYRDTELLRVAAAAGKRAVSVHSDTLAVVRRGIWHARLSDGAFDISIGPLTALWEEAYAAGRPPVAEEIERRRALVDWRAVEVDRDKGAILLPHAGMRLDVGGIAKGFAADEVARLLQDMGVEAALLDFGGTILTIGDKADGTRWRIAIQNPDSDRDVYAAVIAIEAMAVATSGDYERYFEYAGVRYHHIIDSQTGYPAVTDVRSVTVIAPHAVDADAPVDGRLSPRRRSWLPFESKRKRGSRPSSLPTTDVSSPLPALATMCR